MHPLLEKQLNRHALNDGAMTAEFKDFLSTVDSAYHRLDLERLRAEDIQACQNRVLEMIATGSPVDEILAHLSLAVESEVPGTLVSQLAVIAIERHRTEVALRDTEKRLQQAERTDTVGQLVGSVIHDFNNLLTAIHGFVSMLSEGGLSPDAEGEVIREAQQTLERAGALIRQLLKFSHGEPVCLRDIDVNEVLADMTPLLKHVSGPRISIETPNPAALAGIYADKVRLEQILLNLTLNARDAMTAGGALVFRTALVNLDEAEARQRPRALPGTFVHLSACDSGCGIPEERLARIFEPHYTTKAPGKGTGLGLATVFRIVGELHGWIEVESQVGRGTTFHLFLPQAGQPAMAAAGYSGCAA